MLSYRCTESVECDCMRMQYNDVYKSKLNDVSTTCLLPMWMLGNVPSELLIENVKITKYYGCWIGWAISSVDDIFWIFNHLCLFTRSTSYCWRLRKQFRFECTHFHLNTTDMIQCGENWMKPIRFNFLFELDHISLKSDIFLLKRGREK